MPRQYIRPDAQILSTPTPLDNLTVGSALETGAVTGEDDINSIRTQLNQIFDATGAGNWYDAVATINSKKRGLKLLNTDLDDIEEKKLLSRVNLLTDISVPAGVAASGTIVAVAKASLLDTETFTLDDGINAASVFEFDLPPDGVTDILVDVSADTTDVEVATSMVSAINGVGATLLLTASNAGGTSATVTITHDQTGTIGNVTAWADTVVNAGFVVTQPTGGAGDMVILDVSSSEAPTLVSANALTQNGAVVAESAFNGAGFGIHELVEIVATSGDATNPKNLCVVRAAANGQPIQSSGRDIFALLQVESTFTDGTAFDDVSTGDRVKLSFVRLTAGFDDLEHCPAADVAGIDINYSYVRRINFDAIPEDAFLPIGSFIDQAASVDVTLDNAIDNQSGTATQTQDIDWDVADDSVLAFTSDSGATDMFSLTPTGGGDTATLNVDTLDVNLTNDADFSQGIKADTGGTEVQIGVVAGQIGTTGANNLTIDAGGELLFNDANFDSEGTWAQSGVKVTETAAEVAAYETAFGGEVSLFNAVVQAKNSSARGKTVGVITPASIAADTNVTGAGGGANIDAQLGDYSSVSFVTDVDVYLNGQLLRGGADSLADFDVYPGTTPANGDLKFEFILRGAGANPDTITMVIYG